MSITGERNPDTRAGVEPGRDRTQHARQRRYGSAFVGIAVGNFLVLLDAAILNVALPDMRRDLHASAAALPWSVDAYTVVFGGLMLAAGAISDRLGARRVYRVSLIGFALFSLLCAASPNASVLIGGRALLGVAAAGLVPASIALLTALFPEPAQRAKAIGVWAACSTFGLAVGPILGGALVTLGGWRLIFLVNPPIAAITFLASRRLAAPKPGPRRRVDYAGLALSTLGLTGVAFALVDGGTSGWSRPEPWVALAVAIAALVALNRVEKRTAVPALPPALLKLARVRGALVAGGVANLIYYGQLFLMTQWLQDEMHLSPLRTGLVMLPAAVPMALLPLNTGRLTAKYGPRPVIITGLAIYVVFSLVLLTNTAHVPLAVIIFEQFIVVAGATTVIPAATAEMASAAPAHLAATGQGAFNSARQAGSALGVAILGTVTSLHTTGALLAVAGVVGLLVMWRAKSSASPVS